MIENNVPKVFISYSWKSKKHSDWVKSLADKLITDGIEAITEKTENKDLSKETYNKLTTEEIDL